MPQSKWWLFHYLISLCFIFLASSLIAEKATCAEIIDKPESYEIRILMQQDLLESVILERGAEDLAHSRLIDWLMLNKIEWPISIGYEDRKFLLWVFKLRHEVHATISETTLHSKVISGDTISFTFHVPKRHVTLNIPTWSNLRHNISNIGNGSGSINSLIQLEIADRFPNIVSHTVVVRNLRENMGGQFLKFLTGASFDFSDIHEKKIKLSGNIKDLTRGLSSRPYDINLAFLLVSKLRNMGLEKVSCRVAQQGMRGSKMTPAYVALRDYGSQHCNNIVSRFKEGILSSHIASMRSELNTFTWDVKGMLRLIIESFGEIPIKPKVDEKYLTCNDLSIKMCVNIFNKQPGIRNARQLANLFSQENLKMIASSLMHQVSIWENKRGEFKDAYTVDFPESKI